MMHRILLIIFTLCVTAYQPAYAQILPEGGLFGSEEKEDTGDDPPLELPALPEEEVVQQKPRLPSAMQNSSEAYFPSLPPSRLCTKRDIAGFWRLSMVFENPTGPELSDYSASPYQYILFNNNDTFSMYKSSQGDVADADVLKKMRDRQGGVLEQFVMHESGVLYFYKDGVAYDSLACFIVANKLDPFNPGQMLFMPPPDKATVRMVRVYQKVYNAPADQAAKKKKKKKRR